MNSKISCTTVSDDIIGNLGDFYEEIDVNAIGEKVKNAGVVAKDVTVELAELTAYGVMAVANAVHNASKRTIQMFEKPQEEVRTIVNYDTEKSVLYGLIEEKEWDAVIERLDTNPEEASKYLERYDENEPTRLAWRLLPIHAVCYPVITTGYEGEEVKCGIRAKLIVVEKLLEVYPDGAKAKDDQGMIPLHHVCRNGGSIHAINCILDAYRAGIHERDDKGRTPLESTQVSTVLNKEVIVAHLINEKLYQQAERRDDFAEDSRM